MFLFDLDGTLIDSNGLWAEVDRTFLSRRGFPYTRAYYEGVAHTILPKAAVFTKEYCSLSESCEEIMAEWMALARERYAHVPLKPHAKEALSLLRSRGERMALLTSCVPVNARTALGVHSLDGFFERVIYAQDLGLDKGSPEIFRRAARELGVETADCVLLDDSLRSCKSAKEAGLRVIGVYDALFDFDRSEMERVCDRYLTDLGELSALLPL